MFKKIIFTLIFSFTITGSSFAKFNDIPNDFWAKDIIDSLVAKKIFTGYEDGSFKPQKNMSRAEFVTAFIKSVVGDAVPNDMTIKPFYLDVPTSHWAYSYIQTARESGIIQPDDYNNFMPKGEITRLEVCKMIGNSSQRVRNIMNSNTILKPIFADSSSLDQKTQKLTYVLWKTGIITGYTDNTIRLGNKATRAELATLIYRYLAKKQLLDDFVLASNDLEKEDSYIDGIKYIGLNELNSSKNGVQMVRNKGGPDLSPLDVQVTLLKLTGFKYDKDYNGPYKDILKMAASLRGFSPEEISYAHKIGMLSEIYDFNNCYMVALESSTLNQSGFTVGESGENYFEPLFDSGAVTIIDKFDDYRIQRNAISMSGNTYWLKNNDSKKFITFYIVDKLPTDTLVLKHKYLSYANKAENGPAEHKDNLQMMGIYLTK